MEVCPRLVYSSSHRRRARQRKEPMTRTDTAAVKQSYADYVEGYPEDAPVRRGPAAASLTVTTAVIAGDTAYMTGLRGDETVVLASRAGRVILFPVGEVNFLSGPGRGVMAIKLEKGDKLLGSAVSRAPREGLTVHTGGGRRVRVAPATYRVASRAGKGVQVIKRGGLTRVDRQELSPPVLGEESDLDGGRNGNGTSRRNGSKKAGGTKKPRGKK